MKAITSILKNKKLKGNISLLIILILLASSVIALLSINQIQHLLEYGNMTFNYFRSYYLAKAGTELGLTQVYYREAGFENQIESESSIITGNLLSDYSAFNPYFTMKIESNFNPITNDIRLNECEDENLIHLGAGEGMILALFTDITKGTQNILDSKSNIKPLEDDFIKSLSLDIKGEGKLTFGIFSFNEDITFMNDFFVQNNSDLKNFLNSNLIDGKRRYLTIKNAGDEDTKFCITSSKGEIPYSDSLITVRANYGNMEVGLQSVVKKSTPSWSLNVLGDY